MDDDEQQVSDDEPVRVRVARSRQGWTGTVTEEVVAESPEAAQHWDERLWRRP